MDERNHNGGAMAFGNDGKLYITTGDAGERKNAGTFDDVHGSIIRVNEDGTVPDDNPYTKASGVENSYRCADSEGRVPKNAPDDSYCNEVWANGLRNPFRIDMDPNVKDKVKFSFGVVGAQHIEAIYYGGTDYKGTNYGWPKYEGVCKPGDINNCEPNDDPAITMPFHWYEHVSYEDGGCVGGQVHVPEGIWPPEFKYLFIDFIFLKIYSLEENRPDLACDECSPPLPPTRNETFYTSIQKDGDNINEARLVEMWFGPYKDTQALYFTKFGNHDTVIRVRYNGILNKPPLPAFESSYDGGMSVVFDASNTTDPEGDELTYEWDFGDESELLVDETVVDHEYALPGEYAVTLKVTDPSGQMQQISETVKVGPPPKVNILSPVESTTFSVGELLRLKGEAVDYFGNPISDERLTWEVRQHHADHFHPFLDPTTGNDFDLFAAPEPEDYLAATNSHLKVLLTAEDEFGLTQTVSVDVMPHVIMVNVTTQPPGLDVVVDGYDITTPQIITSWRSFKLPVTVNDQPPYMFKEWSTGKTEPSRKVWVFQPNEELPQVRAIFCSDFATECETHDECCSGFCSPGMNRKFRLCAPMPENFSSAPTMAPGKAPYIRVPDPPASDLEIDVVTPPYYDTENEWPPLDVHPKKPILDEEGGISVSLSDSITNGGDGKSEEGIDLAEWISYGAIGVALLALAWIVAVCKCRGKKHSEAEQQKLNLDDGSEEDGRGGSETISEDYYNEGRNIKYSGTGSSTEGSNAASPSSKVADTNNSDISLSFLVPESISSSEPRDADDIENQASAALGSPQKTSSAPDSYLMPPMSPALSLTNRDQDSFDNALAEQNTKAGGMLEYRFDAASTSQSSLTPLPESDALAKNSEVGGALENQFDATATSPSQSLPQECDQKSFDDVQQADNVQVDEILEYRFDAASTSQSSLIPPPQSPASGQQSFDEGQQNRSVSFSIPSPEKSPSESNPETDTHPADDTPTPTADVSFEARDLEEETSDVIDSLVENYFSELSANQDESLSHILDSSDVLLEEVQEKAPAAEEGDEDERVLDQLLSNDNEDQLESPSPQTGLESMQQETATEVADEVQEEVVVEPPTEAENEVASVDPVEPKEDSPIPSESDGASVSEEQEAPSNPPELSIEAVSLEKSDSEGAVDHSPLQSPTLHPEAAEVGIEQNNVIFMSPEAAKHSQQNERDTPETAADSSVDTSSSVEASEQEDTVITKSTGVNLQSSFAASANEQNENQTPNISVYYL
jgi:hypothetical protein